LARKILLADDSVTAQNMGRKILADAGYDVLTVNNGSAALKRVAESAPDLIILDVYMPGYSGLEVCQRLKDAGETAHIPVLLSVGKLEPFKPQEARRVRADAHIVKPFEASQLLTAIARLEDQMVPQQKSSRFATSGAASSADDPFTRPDESRILGRSGKLSKKNNKDTPQAERGDSPTCADGQLSQQAASFRDFKKKAKSEAPGPSPANYSSGSATAPGSHEPGALAKLPGDITAEELSALSEVAAKLNEPAPSTPSIPSETSAEESGEKSAEKFGETFGELSVATSTQIPDSQLEDEVARLPVVETQALDASVPAAIEALVVAAAPEEHETESTESTEPPRPAVKNWEVSAAAKKEVEIPVAQFEPANNFASANDSEFNASEPANQAVSSQAESHVESSQAELLPVEPLRVESASVDSPQNSEVHLPDAVSMASFAQEPAPVDQQDEPIFAAARAEHPCAEEMPQTGMAYVSSADALVTEHAVEALNVDKNQNKDEKKEEFASIDASFAQAPSTESTATVSASAEPASAESVSTESTPVELHTSESISTETPPAAASAGATAEPSEPEAPMPSDEALAEALRFLMPATSRFESEPQSAQTVPAASQWSDAEETMEIPVGRRWVAEAMTLTPEETAMSLEAEMFRSFAAGAEKIESLPIENPLAAIQLAVENRLAAEAAEAQLEFAGEGTPKAMAAAAPAGVASATSAESDIASIVEKVMADLRPKIVEEIARKLAGK
jgi:CheY-like chemotaxis protein